MDTFDFRGTFEESPSVVPNETPVKQNWQIWGSVQYSNYFTWEPRYFIQYTYFVTPLTAA